jgi:streptomycin 6-kinase
VETVTPTFVKTVRGRRELQAQALTLRAFGADRAAMVLDIRADAGELVLERVNPGIPLALVATEEDAMGVVSALLAGGWPEPPEAVVVEPLAVFARALDAPDGRLARARALLRELAAERCDVALLHGDLHYGNVLASDRAGWLLVDPAGVVGPPAFDVGYLVSRPMPVARDHLSLARAIDRRLAFLPDALRVDRQRVGAYAYIAASLSFAWAVEDADQSGAAFAAAMDILEARTR